MTRRDGCVDVRRRDGDNVPTTVRHFPERECATIRDRLQKSFPQPLWVRSGCVGTAWGEHVDNSVDLGIRSGIFTQKLCLARGYGCVVRNWTKIFGVSGWGMGHVTVVSDGGVTRSEVPSKVSYPQRLCESPRWVRGLSGVTVPAPSGAGCGQRSKSVPVRRP
ncbi:hypothetical protein HMPREF9153_0930 [Cutibacterium avidum ATCC 25577]|uniref:Uncharacterized protein n=1 Tax=Cutibacterium avidum ATCC 25577 TaxID=997355 RepID=G4CWM3_9ACTN|nr:hypothetical protein HMPREF9153_0930 [Cutibacterium avidum ATCC 25577]